MLVVLAVVLLAAVANAGCATERARLRAQLLSLHTRAARCGDTDQACTTRLFNRIAGVRKQLRALRPCRAGAVVGIRRPCNPGTTFRAFLNQRRQRISRIAQRCADEDDACIRSAMNLLVALNSDITAQRAIWRRSCKPGVTVIAASPVVPKIRKIARFVPRTVWTHEWTCERIQRGFRLWLASKTAQRRAEHRESMRCPPSDLSCIKMHFDSIINIQRAIHRGRSLFADRMSTCDRCAAIKLRWLRWLRRQRQRRHRLQLAACRCEESDPGCMQRQVDRIKAIQAAIAVRRAAAFRLHGQCIVTTTVAGTTTRRIVETEEPNL